MKIRLLFCMALFIFLSCVLSSCSSIAGFILGIKEVKTESKAQQVRYLRKHKLDTSNLLVFQKQYVDSLRSGIHSINPYKDKKGSSFCPIQFRMFERSGEFYTAWEVCYGGSGKKKLGDIFPPLQDTILDGSKLNLYADLKMYHTLNGDKPIDKTIIGNHKYVITAYWAEYLGVMSLDMLKDLENYIKKFKDKDILLLKVNLGDI